MRTEEEIVAVTKRRTAVMKIIVKAEKSGVTCEEIKNSLTAQNIELSHDGIMEAVNWLIRRKGEFKFDAAEREGKYEFVIEATKKFWEQYVL